MLYNLIGKETKLTLLSPQAVCSKRFKTQGEMYDRVFAETTGDMVNEVEPPDFPMFKGARCA